MSEPFTPPRLSRPLGWAALVLAFLTFGLDLLRPSGSVRANGILDERFFRGFSDFDPSLEGRLGHTASRIEVPGFGPLQEVHALLVFSREEKPLLLDDTVIVSGARGEVIARADGNGWVILHLADPGGKKRGIFGLRSVEIDARPALGPPPRLLLELLTIALLTLLVAMVSEEPSQQVWALSAVGTVFVVLFCAFRPYVVAHLPLVLELGFGGIPFLALARALGVPRRAWSLLLVVFLLRVGLVLLPSFPSIDGEFHAHNVERFERGEVLKSRAPGAERGESLSVPYPPALYAILARLPRGGDEMTVRFVNGLLEGTAPLLVFLILRAGGASPEVAAAGAAVSSCLPEGVLVLGKGIAANILGSWATLWVAWAWLRKSTLPLMAALLALTFLSHWGVSLCVGLMLLWLLATPGVESKRSLLTAALLGAVIAWAIYYREVLGLATEVVSSLSSHLQGTPGDFVRVRWVRVGKTLQDLLLKFGGGSLLLLWLARGENIPPRLLTLLRAWFGAGILVGLLALLTPVPLRFEYFLTAPVAIGSAFGAERLRLEGRLQALRLLLGIGLVLEVVIAVFLVFQRFDLLSVIQESDTWDFPFYIWSRTSG